MSRTTSLFGSSRRVSTIAPVGSLVWEEEGGVDVGVVELLAGELLDDELVGPEPPPG
jgi:hypothetical protein